MAPRLPAVEITDNGYVGRIRCPYREVNPVLTGMAEEVGSQTPVESTVCSLPEEVDVFPAQEGRAMPDGARLHPVILS